MQIKGAIFDVDGTLLDTMGVWHNIGERYLAGLGIRAEEGLGDRLFTETPDSGAKYVVEKYGLSDLGVTWQEASKGMISLMEDFYFGDADYKPGARDVLSYFRNKGIPMVVVTSTDGYCVKGAFERLGIKDCFMDILSAGDLGTTKGQQDIWKQALEILGTKPEETWVFEDGLYAIKVAKEMGMPVAAVYDEMSRKDREDIEKISDIYCRDLAEFKAGYLDS